MSVPGEVPVWVNGVQKWVTGVNKRTTCGELVRALMSAESGVEPPSDAELRMYAIVERWRKVERPLEPTARILKVWRSWSDQLDQVQLVLKRPTAPTPREVKSARRRHHQQSRQQRWRSTSSLEALHPRKLAESCSKDASGLQQPDMVERLMRMIIVQGETIQTQLRRLREREDVISQYEHKMHQTRVHRLGSDYLLRTYLKEGEVEETEKKSNDSGVVVDHVGEADDDAVGDPCSIGGAHPALLQPSLRGEHSEEDSFRNLKTAVNYLDDIVSINTRIIKSEDQCVRLRRRIRRACAAVASKDEQQFPQLVRQAEALREELDVLENACRLQLAEIEVNQRTLEHMERTMVDKRWIAESLQSQADASDAETQRLQSQISDPGSGHNPTSTCRTPQVTETPDPDSNSDTGLSSMHSSSDDVTPPPPPVDDVTPPSELVLDTLV